MYDSIGTTTYCMIICMKSRLMSFSYDSVTEGCISVKCQLLTVNFVGFGCQPGFRLHTSRQSFEPSYTQIQALLVFFLSFALASQPFWLIAHPYCQENMLKWKWKVKVIIIFLHYSNVKIRKSSDFVLLVWYLKQVDTKIQKVNSQKLVQTKGSDTTVCKFGLTIYCCSIRNIPMVFKPMTSERGATAR